MGFARVLSVGLVGVQGHLVEIEADLAQGLPGLVITGLPDTALGQARDRLRAAVTNSGQSWPARRITIGLSPASLPKYGSGFDLGMAMSVLSAAGVLPATVLRGVVCLGELALDGRVRAVRGVLPAVLAATREGVSRVVVPVGNVFEARLVPDVTVVGVASLAGLIAFLRGEAPSDEPDARSEEDVDTSMVPDLAEVVGQDRGRRAIEIAAAGGHHLALFGPPGAGKTMLAERLPGVLPPLDLDSSLEVTAVHSVAGVLPPEAPLIRTPPYQAPHHTASVAALVGGGSGLARPGALSLAHRGVLFLDEAPEFRAGVLDALRQPLERGEVTLARSGGVTHYPARVQLVLAANPCPCSSPATDQLCECPPAVRRRYVARLSGPLMDRIDLQVTMLPVGLGALMSDPAEVEPTAAVAGRVVAAREAAAARWGCHGWQTNSEVPGVALRGRYRLPRRVRAKLDLALEQGWITARGYDRVARVAWSLADLAGRDSPNFGDVETATDLRTGRAA